MDVIFGLAQWFQLVPPLLGHSHMAGFWWITGSGVVQGTESVDVVGRLMMLWRDRQCRKGRRGVQAAISGVNSFASPPENKLGW